MIIEFFYSRFKQGVIYMLIPINLLQAAFFILAVYLNEMMYIKSEEPAGGAFYFCAGEAECSTAYHWTKDDTNEYYFTAFAIANCVTTVFSSVITLLQMRAIGFDYFKKFFSYVEVAFIILNFYLASLQMNGHHLLEQRVLASFLTILIFLKCLYYLKMIDSQADHINIIFEIFFAMQHFLLILGLTCFAFSVSFYLLGRNQIQFDINDPAEEPEYDTLSGSLWVTWTLMLGAYNVDSLFVGEKKEMMYYLLFLFFLMWLSIIVHLLNMLIAIMGDTFNTNNVVKKQKKLKE